MFFVLLVFFKFCFPCCCADCLNNLFWCQSDEIFVSTVCLMVRLADAVWDRGVMLLSKWSTLLLSALSYTPDWRSEVSGVLAVDKYGQMLLESFCFPSANSNEATSHVDTFINDQANSSHADPVLHVKCSSSSLCVSFSSVCCCLMFLCAMALLMLDSY